MAHKALLSTDFLKGEPPPARHAYTIYRDLGTGRSLSEVTRQLAAQRTGSGLRIVRHDNATTAPRKTRHDGHISLWSRKYHWVERAAAWDAVLDARLRSKQLDGIEKMAARHTSQAELLLHGLMAPAQAFARGLQDPQRLAELDATSLVDLYKLMLLGSMQTPRVQKAERLARGVKVVDTEPISNPASAQSPAEWRITVHQPQREIAAPTLESSGPQEPEEWEEI